MAAGSTRLYVPPSLSSIMIAQRRRVCRRLHLMPVFMDVTVGPPRNLDWFAVEDAINSQTILVGDRVHIQNAQSTNDL